MAEKILNARDAKLVQWLNEAYAKESELIDSLSVHIKATEKMSYKKRLRKHLTETRDHRRRVAARIKQLGGSANGEPGPGSPRSGRRGRRQGGRRRQGPGRRRPRRGHSAARDPPAQRPGGAPRGARRDRPVRSHRGAGHRGRRPRDRPAGEGDPARRGADGQIPRCRAGAAGQGARPRGDSARPAGPSPAHHRAPPQLQPERLQPADHHPPRLDRHRRVVTAAERRTACTTSRPLSLGPRPMSSQRALGLIGVGTKRQPQGERRREYREHSNDDGSPRGGRRAG